MNTTVNKPQVQWMAPSLLWSDPAFIGSMMHLQRPVLLRFRSDSFMRDFMAILQQQPDRLKEYIAKPETFRTPPLGALLSWLAPLPSHVKLYLPVHGCFYLVVASLIDTEPNLPDHTVNTTQQEQTRFVLRRLTADGQEMAWISDPAQLPPDNKSWQVLADDQKTKSVPNEALFPLFPSIYTDNGQKRRLLVGCVPTTSRETYTVTGSSGTQVQPKIDPSGAALYILRCIYVRPSRPSLPSPANKTAGGGLRPTINRGPTFSEGVSDIVSDPTERFFIASFTDGDAPARPIHIPGLPDAISSAIEKLHV